MTMSDDLIYRAKQAIRAVWSDTSVPKKDTVANLKDLVEEIEQCIDATESDIDDEEG